MAVALEAIDLGVLLCVLLLIGLLIGVRYTFSKLAAVFDIDFPLIGHPFAGIGAAIENVIVAGCNDGIDALQSVATDLWHWSNEALKLTLTGLHDFVTYAGKSIHWLYTVGVPDAIHAVTDAIDRTATDAHKLAVAAGHDITAEVTARERAVTHAIDTVESWVGTQLHDLRAAIEGDTLAQFPQVQRDVNKAISDAVHGVESATNLTASTLAGAAEQALTNAERVGTLTAEQLRELLDKLKPADVAALIAAIPLIRAEVQALEADTGLGRAECRQKVKGICGTPLQSWLNLLAGLALTAELSNLDDLLAFFQDAAKEIVGTIEPFFRAA